ncbi:sugar phosphate nucleotidyltransferase [Candidatus Tisiphia endosymbiont of Micropterix aruncella]|uniref:sugar phosphate nucleotidyltransferase n=1 Tax=Candidatus Tisiphia endosymbiont of Micropterix aruncella TaxID=3066271 RepID=UPI003AA987B4
MDCQIIVLAAGNGRRMESSLPKVMHEVGGRPMLDRVLTNAKKVTNDVILVHSLQLEEYIPSYKEGCKFALQLERLGTAHAVYTALDLVDDNKIVAVLYGDNPLITANIINDLLDHLVSTNSAITTLCFRRDNPGQYGRIVTDKLGNFLKIVEFKEATNEEQAITICNSGIMAFEAGILKKYLPTIFLGKVDRSKELYLTALVKIAKDSGEKVSYLLSSDHDIVLGVNTKQELEEANKTIAKLTMT